MIDVAKGLRRTIGGAAEALMLIATASSLGQVATPAASANPVVLDRVIAVVNGDVLLESDVQEEMRFAVLQPYSVLPGQNTPQRAAGRLINRSLILQQMKEQETISAPTDQELQQRIEEFKKNLPVCAQYHCQTAEGWKKFLDGNDLTEREVEDRTSKQLLILKFIEVRFRAGIRVSQQEIQDFYKKTLLPQFEKTKLAPPTLASVSARIEEIVLQQKVNVLLQDWLKSLRAQGTVQILDSAYAQDLNADAETGAGE